MRVCVEVSYSKVEEMELSKKSRGRHELYLCEDGQEFSIMFPSTAAIRGFADWLNAKANDIDTEEMIVRMKWKGVVI